MAETRFRNTKDLQIIIIKPLEVANLLAFLAGDQAQAMTGGPVHIDFGSTAGG
jgi:hypothetical protein